MPDVGLRIYVQDLREQGVPRESATAQALKAVALGQLERVDAADVKAAIAEQYDGFADNLSTTIKNEGEVCAGSYGAGLPAGKREDEAASNATMGGLVLPDRVACSYGMRAASYRARFGDEHLDGYQINDRQLGKLFARIHRDVLAFVPEWDKSGSFAAYDGTRWVTGGAVQRIDAMLKEFVLGLQLYCATIEDDDDRRAAQKRAMSYNSHSRRKALREDVASELVRHQGEFDGNPRLLNVSNATIDMSDPTNIIIRGHNPADMLTKVAPVTYDPDAECPLFLDTLATAVEGDADVLEYVHRLFGIICAGDTTRDQFHLVGREKRSGKGTVFGALMALLGEDETDGYAVAVQPDTFATRRFSNSSGPSSDRARMEGKRLILTSEFNETTELDAAFVKQLTGGDLVAARQMRRNERQFRLVGNIVMLTNEYPTISDPAVFESGRAVAVPFEHHMPEDSRDLTLRDRLREPRELSGLLNWCIEGYRQTATPHALPDAIADKTREFLLHSDMLGLYFAERIRTGDVEGVRASDVFEDFKRWNPTDRMGRNEFYRLLRKHVRVSEYGTVGGKRCRNVCEGIGFAS